MLGSKDSEVLKLAQRHPGVRCEIGGIRKIGSTLQPSDYSLPLHSTTLTPRKGPPRGQGSPVSSAKQRNGRREAFLGES